MEDKTKVALITGGSLIIAAALLGLCYLTATIAVSPLHILILVAVSVVVLWALWIGYKMIKKAGL